MSKTDTIDLKEQFKTVETIDKAIALDNQFNYWFLPQKSDMVQDFRTKKCSLKGCKRCSKKTRKELKPLESIPSSVTVKLSNGGDRKESFRLTEAHVQKIHEYSQDCQIQAFDRSSFADLSLGSPLPTVNVFSKRYAPINLERTVAHLKSVLGKPTLEKNFQGLGIMLQFPKLETRLEGLREKKYEEIVNWIPTVLVAHNLSEKSFLYGFTGGIVFCDNQIFLPAISEGLVGTRGMIRHTSGNISRFDLNIWTDRWIGSINDVNTKMKLAMSRDANEIFEIMYYFKASQNVPMLLESFTRPQIDKPQSHWDLAMNITRIGSPQYEPIMANGYDDEKLFKAGQDSAYMLFEEPRFTFGDFLKALNQIETQWHNISNYEDKMRVNFSAFYDFCSELIDQRSKKLQRTSLREHYKTMNEPIDIIPIAE